MPRAYTLMRTAYPTDASESDPDYIGTWAKGVIPGRFLADGRQIVDVDWDREPGLVWVTFLIPEN